MGEMKWKAKQRARERGDKKAKGSQPCRQCLCQLAAGKD